MKRLLLAVLAVCLPAFSQSDVFTISYSATLVSAGMALSVQLPATGSHQLEITEATVSTSEACAFRVETNGAAASGSNATAATIAPLNPETTPTARITAPNFTAWYGANIPAGTAVTPTWTLPAGAIMPLGGGRILTGSGSNKNYILRFPSPCSSTVSFYFSVKSRR
jgi:hypothetical protein